MRSTVSSSHNDWKVRGVSTPNLDGLDRDGDRGGGLLCGGGGVTVRWIEAGFSVVVGSGPPLVRRNGSVDPSPIRRRASPKLGSLKSEAIDAVCDGDSVVVVVEDAGTGRIGDATNVVIDGFLDIGDGGGIGRVGRPCAEMLGSVDSVLIDSVLIWGNSRDRSRSGLSKVVSMGCKLEELGRRDAEDVAVSNGGNPQSPTSVTAGDSSVSLVLRELRRCGMAFHGDEDGPATELSSPCNAAFSPPET